MERFTELELIELERRFDRYQDEGTGWQNTLSRLIDYARRTALEPIKPFPAKRGKRLPNVAQSYGRAKKA